MLKFNSKRFLTDVCTVFGPNDANDIYGHPTKIDGKQLQNDLPCRITPGRGAGKENKNEKQSAMSDYFVYMMPIANFTFDEHMWLVIDNKRYNVIDVGPVQLPGAPVEIRVERVKP